MNPLTLDYLFGFKIQPCGRQFRRVVEGICVSCMGGGEGLCRPFSFTYDTILYIPTYRYIHEVKRPAGGWPGATCIGNL